MDGNFSKVILDMLSRPREERARLVRDGYIFCRYSPQ